MLGLSAMTVYLEPDRTCFEDIRRIPAATVMTFDGTRMSSREYWRPDARRRMTFRSDSECAEAFRDVFSSAVKARLRSTNPAALLSGGLDSSAIVGMAGRMLATGDRTLRTLSIVPEPSAEGQVIDEREWIEFFREIPNLRMEAVSAPGAGPFDNINELVKTGTLLSYGFQHFMYSALARAANRHGCRVLLDGYGGELSASVYPEGYLAELLLTGQIGRMVKELKLAPPGQAPLARKFKSQILRPLAPFRLLKWLNRQNRPDRAPSYPLRAEFIDDILGQEIEDIADRLSRLLATAPDHRKNMAARILLARDDARQRSHAGFIGYEGVRFSYPYLDRRVLEFGLAIDGRYKYNAGQSRFLIRSASRGFVPEAIRTRTSKAPFCPDYHLRYSRQKDLALRQLKAMANSSGLKPYVDFERVFSAIQKEPRYVRENPMAPDYDAQFFVPYAVYLCYFLNRFHG
jgi:asparagine synthase (glutamine-hydrolysing)